MTRSIYAKSAFGLLLASALLVGSVAVAADGSWSAEVPGVMVAMSDRATMTSAVAPAAAAPVGDGRITQVQWRLDAPAGTGAWLCHPERCVALSAGRGTSTALAGLSARAPLHFRLVLASGQRPTRVSGMQVIVNYRAAEGAENAYSQ